MWYFIWDSSLSSLFLCAIVKVNKYEKLQSVESPHNQHHQIGRYSLNICLLNERISEQACWKTASIFLPPTFHFLNSTGKGVGEVNEMEHREYPASPQSLFCMALCFTIGNTRTSQFLLYPHKRPLITCLLAFKKPCSYVKERWWGLVLGLWTVV